MHRECRSWPNHDNLPASSPPVGVMPVCALQGVHEVPRPPATDPHPDQRGGRWIRAHDQHAFHLMVSSACWALEWS